MEATKEKKTWKQKLLHEFEEYLINAVYMALFFSAVVFYRRQLLAEYDIVLTDYFVGVVKALIIAKVVMIGTFVPGAKLFEDRALIVPVFYKAFAFTIWVAAFDILEEFIRSLVKSADFGVAVTELQHRISMPWLGALILIGLSFLSLASRRCSGSSGRPRCGSFSFINETDRLGSVR